MAEGKGVLIAGDLMVDRNWLMPSQSAISTSQAHGDVPPSKLIHPQWQTDVLGGAGVVARAALLAAPNSTIYLVGAWKEGFDPRDFLSPEDEKNKGRIKFIRAAKTPFNTEKFRIYEQSSKGEKLAYRYDRDLYWDEEAQKRRNGEKIYRYNPTPEVEWPSAEDVGVVIVADFDKGLLDMKEVRDKLSKYQEKPFLLRSKRKAEHQVFTELHWNLALPNRDDLGKLVGKEPVESPSFREIGGAYTLNPKLAESLIKFREAFPVSRKYPQRSVLAKLDREGALLYSRLKDQEKLTVLALPDGQPTLAGIGAGDVLAANLAAILLKQKTINYVSACEKAVPRASAFCEGAANIVNAGNGLERSWYGIGVSIKPAALRKKRAGFRTGSVTSSISKAVMVLVDKKQQTPRCRKALDSRQPILIKNASWFLDEFLTVDKELGSEILRLKKEIRTYFEAQERNPKPFVVALCGTPGSGKSALAKAVAEALKVDFREANAAQWTCVDDLFRLCEEVRTIRVKKGKSARAFAFIDEVDTAVGGEKIYGKLLAPLGDGAYSSLGYTRQMGPVVFLLAGSNKPWESKSQLLGRIDEKHPKLLDLVSRFTSPPIQVPALVSRRLDTLYLAASFLQKRFPGVEDVERGVLKLLCESVPKHGPRSIKEAVGMLRTPKNPSCIISEDLDQNEDTIKLHLGEPFPPSWRKDKSLIRIVS